MTETTFALRTADGPDLDYVESLLATSGLPTEDVRSGAGRFYVGYDGTDRVGVGGLELHGTDALLRSVAVEEGVRGEGFGTAICDRLEETARDEGVETAYLLTTTTADFFADRGYEAVERSGAPASVRRTAEFDELCPDSATCMRKRL